LRVNHQRAGAVVEEKRRAHFLDALAKIALRVRFDRQAVVKAVGMAQGRDQGVRTDGLATDFHAAQCRGTDSGTGSVHDEALALKQTKTAPEKIRAKDYAEPGPK
jgi:hypothetical protein